MPTENCIGCITPFCYLPCSRCDGTGIFIGAGIGEILEPTYYGLQHPAKLPCDLCKGEKYIYCPDYRT
jgi:hypothetical protein